MRANKNWEKCSQKLSDSIKIPLWPKELKYHLCFVIFKFLQRVILNYREWLTFQMLQTQGTSIDETIGLEQTSQSSTGWGAELGLSLDAMGWVAALLNRPWGLWQVPNWIEAHILRALLMSKANSIPYGEEQGQQMEGSYYPPLLGTGEAAPGIAHSVRGGHGGIWRRSSRRLLRQPEAWSKWPTRSGWWCWACIVWHGGD